MLKNGLETRNSKVLRLKAFIKGIYFFMDMNLIEMSNKLSQTLQFLKKVSKQVKLWCTVGIRMPTVFILYVLESNLVNSCK